MVAVKLDKFGGMLPAVDDRLLPDNMAVTATNSWLYSGALEGIRQDKLIYTTQSALTKKVLRIPKNYSDRNHIADAYWLEFPYEEVDVLRTPIANDLYTRYYWTSTGTGPRYNTLNRIASGSSSYYLGVPSPNNFPGISSSGGSSTTTVTRAYVYTWVTEYGEEGAPSAAYTHTGKQDDAWLITLVPPTNLEQQYRALAKARIYRTITSAAGVATYFFVAEVDNTVTLYTDTQTDTVVSGNNQLASTNWTEPPTDLEGMSSLPNGMIVGFRNNEVWYCEPYRPHAWPAIYTLSVDSPVVGIGVVGQTAIVCTGTAVYAFTGTHPSVVTQSKLTTTEPCLSRGSIVSSSSGVAYASPNGICLATPSGVANVTGRMFTRDKWQDAIDASKIRAARLGNIYYMYSTVRSGCFEPTGFETTVFEQADVTGATAGGMIDVNDERIAYVQLTTTSSTNNVFNDPWTNEVFVLRGSSLYQIDLSSNRPRSEYTWKSKRFQLGNSRNLEAMKIYFDNPEGLTDFGTVKVYANGSLVLTRAITSSGGSIRLPSGFKSEFWQIEITSRVIISSIQLGTTSKELARV